MRRIRKRRPTRCRARCTRRPGPCSGCVPAATPGASPSTWSVSSAAASTDLLTDLPNRRMLDRALGRLSADDTVIMLDLDHFKRINDTFGHAAGDEVLRVFGGVLRGTVRGRDIVGRFGGEEFLIILPPPGGADAFSPADACRMADRTVVSGHLLGGHRRIDRRPRRDGEPGRSGPLPGQGGRPRPVDLGHGPPACPSSAGRPCGRRPPPTAQLLSAEDQVAVGLDERRRVRAAVLPGGFWCSLMPAAPHLQLHDPAADGRTARGCRGAAPGQGTRRGRSARRC
jgi:GGDEF domain-containing protein